MMKQIRQATESAQGCNLQKSHLVFFSFIYVNTTSCCIVLTYSVFPTSLSQYIQCIYFRQLMKCYLF